MLWNGLNPEVVMVHAVKFVEQAAPTRLRPIQLLTTGSIIIVVKHVFLQSNSGNTRYLSQALLNAIRVTLPHVLTMDILTIHQLKHMDSQEYFQLHLTFMIFRRTELNCNLLNEILRVILKTSKNYSVFLIF